MDSYQQLRKIQKKERDNGTLAQVDETFYKDIHNYINKLKQSAIDDPFSDVYNTLNEAKRIAIEICERREHKITSVAVLNMNRSYQLFSGKQEFDLVDSMPLNMTPEEETFYFSIIETLKNHRLTLSGQIIKDSSVEEDDVSDVENKPDNSESSPLSDMDDSKEVLEKIDDTLENEDKSLKSGDEVLDKLDEISKSKVIDDEVRQPIEKQISKSTTKAPETKKNISKTPSEFDDIEILDDENQFIDLDMPKRTRESEIVTILVLDKIDSIVGIDEKVYGPFRPQDIVLLPKINANIFVKNRKARFVKI